MSTARCFRMNSPLFRSSTCSHQVLLFRFGVSVRTYRLRRILRLVPLRSSGGGVRGAQGACRVLGDATGPLLFLYVYSLYVVSAIWHKSEHSTCVSLS
jgi:hypothetical protein